MSTEQAALNERALQELASIQADIDNGRDRETYARKVAYLNELVADLPKERQAHFYAEARRLKFKLDGSDAKPKTNDPSSPDFDPGKPVVTESGGISAA
jgi:hypothetical protein